MGKIIRLKELLWILAALGLAFGSALCFAALSGSLDEKSIAERLKPVGVVSVEASAGQPAVASTPTTSEDIGEKRFEETCKMCHGTGIAGAPKIGDKSDWAPRIAEGEDTLVNHAIHGYKAMPPKGGCMNCSDEEIKKAVEYMLSKVK